MIYVRLPGEELEWMCAIAGQRAVAIKQRVSISLEGLRVSSDTTLPNLQRRVRAVSDFQC